jgi:hypothetical protein
MRFPIFLFSGLLAVFAVGCGSSSTNLNPDPSKKTVENRPDWADNPPNDSNHLYSTATATSRKMQLAIQKATTQARAELARKFEAMIANLTKSFEEELGVDDASELLQQFTTATKIVTNQTLSGSEIDKKEIQADKGIYRAYVLMKIPIGKANRKLLDKLLENEENEIRFRGMEFFKELEVAAD